MTGRDVRQDLPQEDAPATCAEDHGRVDIVHFRLLQRLRSHHPAEPCPVDDDDGDDDRGEPGADHRHQKDRQEHRRKRHPDVDETRDCRIDPAAEIAGGKTESGTDQTRGEGGDHGNRQRDAAAEDHSGQKIPAKTVRSQHITRLGSAHPGGRHGVEHQVLFQRIMRRDQRGEDRGERQKHEEAAGDEDARLGKERRHEPGAARSPGRFSTGTVCRPG